jgi:hypothetical protein
MFRFREPRCNNRTSGAKAHYAPQVYGTAEAVPFVQRLALRKPKPHAVLPDAV